jgi:antirestriction protein
MTSTTSTPRVWIGCLASYNAGRLIGEWTDATDTDELESAQKRVAAEAVKAAKAAGEYPVYFGDPEEFMIADYDGFPSSVVTHLGEYPDYEDVVKFATLIEERGFDLVDAAASAIDDVSELDEDWIDTHYRGEWEDDESFAFSVIMETGWSGVPAQVWTSSFASDDARINVFDELSSYLDMESIASEMFRHGNYTSVGGHVFEDEV